MSSIELFSKTIGKLSWWGRAIWYCLTIVLSGYCIARYGLWAFMLHVIFSP